MILAMWNRLVYRHPREECEELIVYAEHKGTVRQLGKAWCQADSLPFSPTLRIRYRSPIQIYRLTNGKM